MKMNEEHWNATMTNVLNFLLNFDNIFFIFLFSSKKTSKVLLEKADLLFFEQKSLFNQKISS
jgi:hypothetical protein